MNKRWLMKKTMIFRHSIVKLVAPKLYKNYLYGCEIIRVEQAVPRPMTLFLKERTNAELVGLEIGVWKGENALSILKELDVKKLFLVDPYIPYVEDGNISTISESHELQIMQNAVKDYPQCRFIRKSSDEALKDIDEPLDFAYIDGNHSYEYVKRDITNYYPLVKKGGVIGGHDYVVAFWPGVIQAVNEFVKEHNRSSFYAVFPDWWIIKEEEGKKT